MGFELRTVLPRQALYFVRRKVRRGKGLEMTRTQGLLHPMIIEIKTKMYNNSQAKALNRDLSSRRAG
jgi:hypothetical protein